MAGNAQQSGNTASPPSHPAKLAYDSLDWEVPMGTPYREELPCGAIAYIATDSALPLVKMTVYIRHSSLADTKGKEGISSLFTTMLRNGGTKKYPADSLDEQIDLLAGNFDFSASESQMTFTASFLSEYTEKSFAIIREMMYHPVFDSSKFEKERTIMIEAVRHRFDNPAPTLALAYKKQMYAQQVSSAMATESSLKNIFRNDLVALHRARITPHAMIVCISGAFNRESMKTRINSLFASDLPAQPPVAIPSVVNNSRVRSLLVHTPISQAYVRLGLPLFQRPHPDYYAMSLVSEILGGGGFTSRLGEKVRSDAGLTYSISSLAESNYTYPATFHITFFTKNETFAEAVDLTLAEVRKMIDSGVTATELSNAKKSLLGELPSMFRSPDDIVTTYGWNEYYHRAPDHFKVYEQKLDALTREDLSRVARAYLVPDSISMTVVGDTTALLVQKSGDFALAKRSPEIILPESIPALP